MHDSMVEISVVKIGIGCIVASALAILSWRFGALTKSGSVGMMVIGTIVFGLGGISAAIPIVFFFVSASLLSRITNSVKTQALDATGKTGARDFYQVFANGGIGALCLLAGAITANQLWLYAYLASLGEACADTWATEIGTLAKRRPVSIVTFKPVEPGQSGGVSPWGTLSAIAGATATVAVAFAGMTAMRETYQVDLSILAAVVIAGFVGSVVDSILGATVQAQYRCSVTGKVTEKTESGGQSNNLISGWRWIGNDAVNTAGTLTAAITALILLP